MSLVGTHRPRPTPLLRNMIRITSPTRSDFLASGYFDNQQQILFLLNLLFTFCNGGATMLKPCIGFTAHSALLQRHLPELPLPVCLSGKLKAPATCLELWILAFSHASGCRNDLVLLLATKSSRSFSGIALGSIWIRSGGSWEPCFIKALINFL